MLIKGFLFGALAATAAARSAVMDLIPSNFDDVVLKSGKPTLVEFFAPWCGHCKNLAPVYEDLAIAFEHAKDKVQIAKVDADAEKSLGKRFGVRGFPTLKFFDGKSDTPLEYSGGRDLESLSDYITEQTGVKPRKKQEMPSEVEVLTDETFGSVVGGDKNVLVAFTAPWCGHCKKLAPTWETVANDFANDANVVIAKVNADAPNGKATAQAYDVTSYPTVKFFPAGSKEAVAYEGGRNEKDFLDFVNEKVGTHRVPGGGLDISAGTIGALDTVITKLSGSNIAEIAAEVSKEAEKLKEDAQYKYAEYYVRVFDKLSKSDGYAAKELARLEGILSKGGLAPTKRDEIQSRTNVLRKFVEQLTEKVQEAKEEL
ncbi:Protein disulfide-isomerase-like protein [Hapsidospora chrysogenum ATCC 11550]|uniref:protein disulfide-isomerase n=1 Tax=Hapsidospora chrysogenum (strain ATCC 11550 / CBS 779.69 / DSM 880 / IAM 14645 / JCM 23072 / IMI 49137) TaxID=857340 RepID=A0A086TE76_HAPC1|nr:Protein disulfide-isomerase-like protein [Hapsidospora chrysogenum ATCC 11550]